RFASFGTPIAVNLASGVVGSVFVFLGFLLTKGKLADFFGVMIALTASTATLAYLFVFPALVVLRKKYPDAHRPYRVPGGMFGAWICVILTELVVVLTGFTLLWPGLIDGLLGRSYDIRASWGVSRAFFESVTLGSFAVLVLIGVVFWRIGERNRARGIAGEPWPRARRRSVDGRRRRPPAAGRRAARRPAPLAGQPRVRTRGARGRAGDPRTRSGRGRPGAGGAHAALRRRRRLGPDPGVRRGDRGRRAGGARGPPPRDRADGRPSPPR